MGTKKIRVKGHYRNLSDGGETFVSPHTREIETDKSYDEWFNPRDKTGWKKDNCKEYRRRKVFESTDGRKSNHNRYIEAGRKMQTLANVTEDKETHKKAKKDADYFFKMAKKNK